MQKLLGTLITIAIAIGLFMYRSSQRDKVNDLAESMPERVLEVCKRSPGYSQYESFVLEHAQHAFDHAYDSAFDPGGRRRSAKLDTAKYVKEFSADLISQEKLSKPDQKLDLFLRQLQIDLEQAASRGEFG